MTQESNETLAVNEEASFERRVSDIVDEAADDGRLDLSSLGDDWLTANTFAFLEGRWVACVDAWNRTEMDFLRVEIADYDYGQARWLYHACGDLGFPAPPPVPEEFLAMENP